MGTRWFVTLALVCGAVGFAATGCGSGSGDAPPGGASDADVDAPADDGGPDADATLDAGPCDALGTWTLTYEDAGAGATEHVVVAAGDAGAFDVTFFDRAPPVSSCGLPDGGPPATFSTSAALDAATCTLTLGYHATYCFSGEDQCVTDTITLHVVGDAATGTSASDSGWCMDTHPSTRGVTAARTP